jgi:lysozyme family protein
MDSLMANVELAIDYALGWEDATLSGVITKTADGKRTRFGIDEHWHPELTNSLFFSSMGRLAALQVARSLYEREYAQPLCIAEIANQDVANKLLSLGINIGVVPAAKMLQDVLGVEGDGRIGPLTLDNLERFDAGHVLDELRISAETYYESIVARNPEDAVNLPGWLRRITA